MNLTPLQSNFWHQNHFEIAPLQIAFMIFLDCRQLNYTAAFQNKWKALMCLFELLPVHLEVQITLQQYRRPCSKTGSGKMDIFNVTLQKALFLLQVSGKKTKSLRSSIKQLRWYFKDVRLYFLETDSLAVSSEWNLENSSEDNIISVSLLLLLQIMTKNCCWEK